MKMLPICVILVSILLSFNNLSANSVESDTSELSLLHRGYSESVEWNYLGQVNILSEKEIRAKLSSLLSKLAPTEIFEQHKGDSGDSRCNYGVIRLKSAAGDYRIFYYCEKVNGEELIKKIRINKL